VLNLVCSLGAWGATQTGLRYAVKYKYQTVITMDADGQHKADSLPILFAELELNQNIDVIIGEFTQRGSISRRIAWSFFRKLSGITIKDLTSGLRVYNRKAICLLASSKASLIDYQDMGVLLLLHHAKLHIKEVSIIMQTRVTGHSRIFNSWWNVGNYMLHTLLLCLIRRK
jgi:glycosyltransferase involved in cell wall biosynthesis